jgi:peptidoglycan/LPS O-acetylase OafA/YrhL
MGTLRLLLAAAVVAEHSTPIFGLSFTGGHLAVRLFFIISGFYMALILSTKYTADHPNRYWLFISNRFLRIYPCYYVVLFLSLAFYTAGSLYLHHPADRLILWQTAWQHNQFLGLFLVSLCQLTVIGMDAVCFFVYNPAHGIYLPGPETSAATVAWLPTPGAPADIIPAWRFMFVAQSWSISIELLFYLLVPLLMNWRTRNLVILAGLSLVSYVANCLFVYPALSELLGYFFFPFHLFLFILGMLACRHSADYLARVSRPFKIAMVTALAVGLALSQFLPKELCAFLPVEPRSLICIVLVALSLPILFDWTKKSRLQKWIGDLSYPVYICHILVKWGLLAAMGVTIKGVTNPPGWLLLVCSVALAALLLWLVDYPIDRWRQRRVKDFQPRPRPVTT